MPPPGSPAKRRKRQQQQGEERQDEAHDRSRLPPVHGSILLVCGETLYSETTVPSCRLHRAVCTGPFARGRLHGAVYTGPVPPTLRSEGIACHHAGVNATSLMPTAALAFRMSATA